MANYDGEIPTLPSTAGTTGAREAESALTGTGQMIGVPVWDGVSWIGRPVFVWNGTNWVPA